MPVKLDHQFPKFDPNEYRNLPPRDRIGDHLRQRPSKHEVVAELMKTPNGERVWEIKCRKCFHGYCLTDSQITKLGAQPCMCDNRRQRDR